MKTLQPDFPRVMILVVICILGCSILISCEKTQSNPAARRKSAPAAPGIQLPKVDEQVGTAVVMIIDTSGSMAHTVGNGSGAQVPKHEVARRAMQQVVDSTDDFLRAHPDRRLKMGLVAFSGTVETALPVEKFDKQSVTAAIDQISRPGGGTAIGRAIEEGFVQLYSAGCFRKYLIVVTDGANTVQPDPATVSKQLFDQTSGEVEMHFVAFDTQASSFEFLNDVNGKVVEAADEQQLRTRIQEIYDRRIFAEEPIDSGVQASDDGNKKND